MLDDGTYEVIVIDAEERADGVIAIELAVSSGAHRGEVISIATNTLQASWIDLLAAPGTLIVTNGQPDLTLD
jgi:hypothetical protein